MLRPGRACGRVGSGRRPEHLPPLSNRRHPPESLSAEKSPRLYHAARALRCGSLFGGVVVPSYARIASLSEGVKLPSAQSGTGIAFRFATSSNWLLRIAKA